MDWLEQELKQALERKMPAPDFVERVTAARRPRVFRMPRWLPAAAAIIIMAGSGVAYREYQGRVAKEKLMEAMRITAGTLSQIQTHVREVRP